jgi:hypothetical protein
MTFEQKQKPFDINNIYIDDINKPDRSQSMGTVNQANSDTSSPVEPVGSCSWANIVDTELSDHMKNKLLNSSTYESKNAKEQVCKPNSANNTYNISDIIIKSPENIDDVTILEYQTYVSSHLKKYIKQCYDFNKQQGNHKLDYNLHISKFEWLAKASKYLSDKLGLVIVNHKINATDVSNGIIPRSSYKFCEYNYDCQFNYKEKYNGCFAQHFVHNLVYADIIALIQYLTHIYNSENKVNYEELIKCITTISYVIKHMSEELSNLQFHYGNISSVHMERSQIKRDKKKRPNKIKFKQKGTK